MNHREPGRGYGFVQRNRHPHNNTPEKIQDQGALVDHLYPSNSWHNLNNKEGILHPELMNYPYPVNNPRANNELFRPVHPRGPSHHMFPQHCPFGRGTMRPAPSNQYFAPRYPCQFDRRRGGRRYYNGAGMPDESGRRANSTEGPQHQNLLNGQRYQNSKFEGARPKVVQNPGSKKKFSRRKKSLNNVTQEYSSDGHAKAFINGRSNDTANLVRSQTEPCQMNVTAGVSVNEGLESQMETAMASNCDSIQTINVGNVPLQSPVDGCEADYVESSELEGAVGGVGVISEDVGVQRLGSEKANLGSISFDKDLIDEGAFCDLDKMFQNQENYESSEEGLAAFSDDSEREAGHSSKRKGQKRLEVSSDEEPGVEGHIVNDLEFKGNLPLVKLDSNTQLCKNVQMFHNRDAGTRSGHNNRNEDVDNRSQNSEEGEDTGDFIDTDLPLHSKHILSSSDEMDNLSSCSLSDHEEKSFLHFNKPKNQGNALRKDLCSDFNCNDLSNVEPKVLNELETLSLNGNDIPNGIYSSQVKIPKYHEGIENMDKGDASVKKSRDSSRSKVLSYNSSSSESENGDVLNGKKPLPQRENHRFSPKEPSTLSSCGDGAAASQLLPESDLKFCADPLFPCHPGADCELPPTSSQCFHHDSVQCPCPGGSNMKKESPSREHAVLTASSEQAEFPAGLLHSQAVLGSASCSSTAEAGACCPPHSHQLSLNNLSECCSQNHAHVANGFSENRGANFSNDESNRHQKVFVKFPMENHGDKGDPQSASCEPRVNNDRRGINDWKPDNDSGGSEEPVVHDSSENVDMVLLPMEEEIEPVHYVGGLCAGGADVRDEDYPEAKLSAGHGRASKQCDKYHCSYAREQNPLGYGMPSKEFYELIKTVSASDSVMRFFDKDGQDVQRKDDFNTMDSDANNDADDDEESSEQYSSGSQNSKKERLKVDRVMIWNEYEAYVVQFKQIAVSACGQTAVLNVMKALNFSCDKSAVCKVIKTALRKEDACIPEYLFSRACAGTPASELMEGVNKLSGGTVGGRFFHFWPPRKVKLLQWLAYWMKRGAIPMATLNLQQGPHSMWQVPDSWHHQMVYGVSHQGLHLTNPLEIVSERSAMKQLSSDSVLLVRRSDIISRFRETTDLSHLLNHPDPRWRTMNVLGQVVNILREFNMPSVPGYRIQVTSHVKIPASYQAGITLFMNKSKPAWLSLLSAPELPLEDT